MDNSAQRLTVPVVLASLIALGGCAVTNAPQPVGPDTYMISSVAAMERGGQSGAKSFAVADAGAYCRTMGKDVLVENMASHQANVYGAGSAEVIFRCLAKEDPEMKRPNFQRSPDVVLEQRNR